MRAIPFLAVTIISGAIAGTILAIINLGLVEPYIDQAIALEVQKSVSAGENVNLQELSDYRIWQKGGAIAAGAVYGVSLGALFGIVFAYGRNALPGDNTRKKALFLAGVLWFGLFLAVSLKYPANPPAVGDPETIYYREGLYIAYLAISGFTALGLALLWNKIEIKSKRIVLPLIYAAIMIIAYVSLPPNPDSISISMELIQTFRILTVLTIGIFWGILGIVFGSLWDRFIPREEQRMEAL
ncbi:MAG TPA: CbtA family protein [Nitrososphaeraceae archaeon]